MQVSANAFVMHQSGLPLLFAAVSVDITDASGTSESDTILNQGVQLHKLRLDAHGHRLSRRGDSEYHQSQISQVVDDPRGPVMSVNLGAAIQHMGDMEAEIEAHEGCRVYGSVVVRRVSGKLHFSVHQQSFMDVLPQMLTGHVVPRLVNMTHIIHKVAFGPEYPGQVNPLDGFKRILTGHDLRAYKYFLKVGLQKY